MAGSGPEGRIIARDIEAAAAVAPRLTPLAREVARTEGLKPGDTATGLGGKTAVQDLIAYNPVMEMILR
jgi:pyruvate dehydrogenase E2 component (dihydrolipoamide acetyltransferase)